MIKLLNWKPTLGSWPTDSGIEFGVWAPDKQSIEVELVRSNAQPLRQSLIKRSDGVFGGIHTSAAVGDLYRYRINGKESYPDPASRFQPQGVHGPSQIVDPSRFNWTDHDWQGHELEDLIFYEMHVGTFSPKGTFEAVTRRLAHLVQLGVTALELMPLGDFAGNHNWGYDGVALFAPARCYGQPDDLRFLIDAAHCVGLAVFIDVVYNHFGPDGNYTGVFSPYYVKPQEHTAWGSTLNFDGEHNAFVRSFFIENALHWIHDFHADGLRLDATHAIIDKSSHHFLAELTSRVAESVTDRRVHIIAEDCRNLVSLIRPEIRGGEGLSGVWSDDFHHQMRRMLLGDHDGYFADFSDRLDDLMAILNHGWLYTGQYSEYFKAPRGTDPTATPLSKFVFFIQNHDQIGNRATGDRIPHKLDAAGYRAASGLLLSLPQTPLLFMGQEWATRAPFLYFTDHNEELGKLVTQGRLKEFNSFTDFYRVKDIPDPQSLDTFLSSKLRWAEIEREPYTSVWLFYRALIKWRKEDLAPLNKGGIFMASSLGSSTLLIQRTSKDHKAILVVVQLKGAGVANLTTHPSLRYPPHQWDVILTSEEKAYCQEPQPPEIQLSGEAPVLEFDRPGIVILKQH